ncbi:unnamed protein product [Urochloa decumbens]|uniref:F-box domain-containing protein n=1 Tax=Urochloa decumbens TaxID=240449 RepID=A0ABC9F2J4_9POAL
MAAPPPPELVDDAVAEILLRVPPSDPAILARASAVCKSWRRVLSDPVFPRRYRAFHHGSPPPLLGFLRSSHHHARKAGGTAMFVPVETHAPFLEPTFRCAPLDCRHGRVLLDTVGGKKGTLAVWDPSTGDHELLPEPDGGGPCCRSRSGVVLCAAAAGCDDNHHHRDCHGGRPYRVVFVGNTGDRDMVARAWVYSSEAAEWTPPASLLIDAYSSIERKRAAIVGNKVYFLLTIRMGARVAILKYDLGEHRLSTIRSPLEYSKDAVVLMSMEDGLLGLAGIIGSTLELWLRKVDSEGVAVWEQYRVIELQKLLHIDRPYHRADVIGFAESVGVLLVGVDAMIFMFELRSGQVRRLSKPGHCYDVFPFTKFYVPDFTRSKLQFPAEPFQGS